MAEYVQLVKRALKHLGGHGGVRGAVWQLLRVNDLKTGTLIGVDKYGNKYYEDKRNFFGRHRWVIYTNEMNGKNTFWEVDGSMVPPEWLCSHVSCMSSLYACLFLPQAPTSYSAIRMLPVAGIWKSTCLRLGNSSPLRGASMASLYDRRPSNYSSTSCS
ncbi:NADH dehydrogenase [ubiquinone] 1 alpha subcomplex subunit 12 isoform X2 [Struthio camelus]|uniref:NADH dehydrogenase [ubiquinone] 1 alpha subcomplex subunit 12 isoform X2 n=1 Tax=Struthio camelus TaxID=8801 RepID=UPI0036040A18